MKKYDCCKNKITIAKHNTIVIRSANKPSQTEFYHF